MCQKWKRPSRLLLIEVQKPASVMVWGVHQCPRHGWSTYMWSDHWCIGLQYIGILETYAAVKMTTYPRNSCLFQQDNARPHSPQITTAWLRSHRVHVIDWPACSPDLSPIENVWRIMKRRIRQRRPQTVHRLFVFTKNGQKFHLEKLQRLISSVPKGLQRVIKRKRWCYPVVNMPLFQKCLVLQASNSKFVWKLLKSFLFLFVC